MSECAMCGERMTRGGVMACGGWVCHECHAELERPRRPHRVAVALYALEHAEEDE